MNTSIVVFTGNRADSSLLAPVCSIFADSDKISMTVLVGGAHTVEMYKDCWNIWYQSYNNFCLGDSFHAVDENPGKAFHNTVAAASEYFLENRPDIVVLYADRIETFAVACAAFYAKIPILHFEGGDETFGGTFDDQQRHCVSLMAEWHCVTSEAAINKLKMFGVDEDRIAFCGVPSLKFEDVPENRASELLDEFGFCFNGNYGLVTMHPIPRNINESIAISNWLISEIDKSEICNVIWTYPNSDPGSKEIIDLVNNARRDKILFIKALGHERYFSLLNIATQGLIDLSVIGNSSSITKETGFYNVNSLLLGTRQRGRHINGTVEIIDDPLLLNLDLLLKKNRKKRYLNGTPRALDFVSAFNESLDSWGIRL